MKFELGAFNRNVPDEELLQDLVAADAKLKAKGEKLTFRSYRKFGKYSPSTIGVRFGSWNDGLRRAGITPSEEKNVPVEALSDNLKLVWIAKGRQPVYRDMAVAPSQYAASIYNDRFGGWRKALEEFVATVDQERNDLLGYEAKVKSSRGWVRQDNDLVVGDELMYHHRRFRVTSMIDEGKDFKFIVALHQTSDAANP